MYLDRMSYPEVEAYLKEKDSVLIVTGSTENHGKHMPLGTDTMIPVRIMEMIEERVGSEIVIAPALPYGCTEDLRGFAGTISLGMDGLTMVLSRICNQLFDYGFRHFVILNGHGGNCKAIEQVGLELYARGGLLARVDWWLLAGQLNPFYKGGHGGGEETAGVMAVDENLIKREWLHEGENMVNDISDELPTYSWTSSMFRGGTVTIPRPINRLTDNGWLAHGMGDDAPDRATAEWGREMLKTVTDWVAELIPVFARAACPEKR